LVPNVPDARAAGNRWSEADAAWLALYALEKCELVESVAPALRSIRASGLATGIVTSGSRDRVLSEVHTFGLDDLFQTLVFSEDCTRKKPDPEALLLASVGSVSTPPTPFTWGTARKTW
jgi:beta-phosphoglucomutase-like phosphatase (HAD superfamily)